MKRPTNKAERRALGKKLVMKPEFKVRVVTDKTKYVRKEKHRGYEFA